MVKGSKKTSSYSPQKEKYRSFLSGVEMDKTEHRIPEWKIKYFSEYYTQETREAKLRR